MKGALREGDTLGVWAATVRRRTVDLEQASDREPVLAVPLAAAASATIGNLVLRVSASIG